MFDTSRNGWYTHITSSRESDSATDVKEILLTVLARARSGRLVPRSIVVACISAMTIGVTPLAGAMVVAEDPLLAGGGYAFKRSEVCLMKRINRARRARGMSGLSWDKQMSYVARRHAYSMAARRSVYHDYAVGQKITRWRRLAQNTGRGRRCRGIFRSFMSSSAHRGNIFGRWRHLGVGTYRAGGRLYVQQLFESRLNPGNVYSYP